MAKDHAPDDAASPAMASHDAKPAAGGKGNSAEAHPAENAKNDAEVAAMTRTIQPHSDAPSRSGIQGGGSGADSERG